MSIFKKIGDIRSSFKQETLSCVWSLRNSFPGLPLKSQASTDAEVNDHIAAIMTSGRCSRKYAARGNMAWWWRSTSKDFKETSCGNKGINSPLACIKTNTTEYPCACQCFARLTWSRSAPPPMRLGRIIQIVGKVVLLFFGKIR